MRLCVSEELDRESDEIVAIARHHTSAIQGGVSKLIFVTLPGGAGIVDSDRVNSPVNENLHDAWAEVFVEEEFHFPRRR
jgi:hypothetical protein